MVRPTLPTRCRIDITTILTPVVRRAGRGATPGRRDASLGTEPSREGRVRPAPLLCRVDPSRGDEGASRSRALAALLIVTLKARFHVSGLPAAKTGSWRAPDRGAIPDG